VKRAKISWLSEITFLGAFFTTVHLFFCIYVKYGVKLIHTKSILWNRICWLSQYVVSDRLSYDLSLKVIWPNNFSLNTTHIHLPFALVPTSTHHCSRVVSVCAIDISQYKMLFGLRTVFRLNCLTAQPSYEGRAPVEGAK
jgi:hypothetical protein